VDIEGTTTSVTVPKGGVEEGQSFTIPMPTMQVGLPRVNVPVGQWRDGICDCCKYGMCHNHLWTSCCCCLSMYILYRVPCVCRCSRSHHILTKHTYSFGRTSHYSFTARLVRKTLHKCRTNNGGLLDTILHDCCLLDILSRLGTGSR
jgi:hypothetical protein